MDNLFENEYTMETKYFKEYVYNVLCKKIICSGVIIGVIGILFFTMVHSKVAYITLTAGFIAFLSAILIPIVSAKELEKSAKSIEEKTKKRESLSYDIDSDGYGKAILTGTSEVLYNPDGIAMKLESKSYKQEDGQDILQYHAVNTRDEQYPFIAQQETIVNDFPCVSAKNLQHLQKNCLTQLC